MKAINRGFFASAFISAAAAFVISGIYLDSYKPAIAVSIGLVLAAVIQVLTQYFTDTKYKPVQEIAESTVTGPATTILSGLLDRPGVHGVLGADPGRGHRLGLLPGWLDRRAALLHRARRHGHAHHGGRGRLDGHLRSDLGQRPGHRGDVGGVRGHVRPRSSAASTRSATPPRPSPRAWRSPPRCWRPPRCSARSRRRCAAPGSSSTASAIDQPDVLVGLLIGGSVPFLFSSLADSCGGPRRGPGGAGGPQAVPRPPRDHDLRRRSRTTAPWSTSAPRPRCAS